jgi:hypothetical protein
VYDDAVQRVSDVQSPQATAVVGALQAPADRVHTAEMLANEFFVDDCDVGRAGGIRFLKFASRAQSKQSVAKSLIVETSSAG